MTAATVQDFLSKIFSPDFDCPRRNAPWRINDIFIFNLLAPPCLEEALRRGGIVNLFSLFHEALHLIGNIDQPEIHVEGCPERCRILSGNMQDEGGRALETAAGGGAGIYLIG
jgi:hypothetical protein